MALDPATHRLGTSFLKTLQPKAAPVTRQGWHEFYARMYNKHQRELLATLACWHQLLFLAFGETPMSEINEQIRKELLQEKTHPFGAVFKGANSTIGATTQGKPKWPKKF